MGCSASADAGKPTMPAAVDVRQAHHGVDEGPCDVANPLGSRQPLAAAAASAAAAAVEVPAVAAPSRIADPLIAAGDSDGPPFRRRVRRGGRPTSSGGGYHSLMTSVVSGTELQRSLSLSPLRRGPPVEGAPASPAHPRRLASVGTVVTVAATSQEQYDDQLQTSAADAAYSPVVSWLRAVSRDIELVDVCTASPSELTATDATDDEAGSILAAARLS